MYELARQGFRPPQLGSPVAETAPAGPLQAVQSQSVGDSQQEVGAGVCVSICGACGTEITAEQAHRCPGCKGAFCILCTDEYRFLDLVAALQVPGNRKSAVKLAATWMPPAAQRIGLEQCEVLSRDLALANHRLNQREISALDMSTNSFKVQLRNPTTNAT